MCIRDRLKRPSRGIYRGYTHVDAFFEPDEKEEQGSKPPKVLRPGPSEEIIRKIQGMVNKRVNSMAADPSGHPSGDRLILLATACFERWADAYGNKQVLNRIVKEVDFQYLEFKKNPEALQKEWHGAGKTAEVVRILKAPLQNLIDQPVSGTSKDRRTAWKEMFLKSRNWHVQHRRAYSNQTMIVDLNIYRCNEAIRALAPKEAWPPKVAIGLLHEAVGLEPWRGSWDENGNPDMAQGNNYFVLTQTGLSKELGYVGGYGEIIHDLVREMYDATRRTPTSKGDPKIREQLAKIGRARLHFRYPHFDDVGYHCMRLESIVGWRDWKYPGDKIVYDQVPSRTGGPADIAYTTGDPVLIGMVQQMAEAVSYTHLTLPTILLV